ncbi:MAG: hypothetical protein V4723_07280 [Pseudomonadota bacterium]
MTGRIPTRTDISATLGELGERVFNSGKVTRVKASRSMTGLRTGAAAGGAKGASAAGPDSVRRQLHALVKRTPQVMVRISGGGRSVGHVKAHLDYISRDGKLALEDQAGGQFWGKDDVNALRDEWRDHGVAMEEGGGNKGRQAFNIVLSMPAGTNEIALLRAARDFARAEFFDYQYALVLHTQDSDPGRKPSRNPHVHLCVKATSLTGTRLNPRKADLQRWREGFAHHLREHGVEADATRRLHRLQPVRGDKQSVRRKKERGESFDQIGKAPASPMRVARSKQLEKDMVGGLQRLVRTLASSDQPGDRRLALDLMRRFSGRDVAHDAGPEPQRAQGPAPERG